ncbi:hypothetical protein WM06_33120 [Burkholderia cepacia]|nr:hypothetical protein WM06_33120 [Burkholderia cepacia]
MSLIVENTMDQVDERVMKSNVFFIKLSINFHRKMLGFVRQTNDCFRMRRNQLADQGVIISGQQSIRQHHCLRKLRSVGRNIFAQPLQSIVRKPFDDFKEVSDVKYVGSLVECEMPLGIKGLRMVGLFCQN